MNELDIARWKKIERLSDKISFIFENLAQLRDETEAVLTTLLNSKTGPASVDVIFRLWEVANHFETKEATVLFKEIANTRTDRNLR